MLGGTGLSEPLCRGGTPDDGKVSTDFLGTTAPDVDAVVDPPSDAWSRDELGTRKQTHRERAAKRRNVKEKELEEIIKSEKKDYKELMIVTNKVKLLSVEFI